MKRWKLKRCFAALLLILYVLAGGLMSAMAEQEDAAEGENASAVMLHPGLTMEAEIGYDGAITYLRKIPVKVTLKNDGADFEGVLAMNIYRDAKNYDRYEMPVIVAKDAEVAVEMPVELTTRQTSYELELVRDGEIIASHSMKPKRIVDPSTLLVGVLGENSLTYMHITKSRDPLKRGELWQTVDLTSKSFPHDAKSLEMFAFLAIDGFDMGTLSPEQQQALETWLQNGGVAIVGGGAQAGTGYPYFEKYTGIKASAPAQSADVTPALLSFFKSAEEPFGQEMMLVTMRDSKNGDAKTDEGAPLLDFCPIGKGYVVTAAFSLSDKPLISWQGEMALWQRVMLAGMSSHYQRVAEKQVEFYSREDNNMYGGILYNIEIENDNSFFLPMVLLVLFLVLVGFGSYMVLKKRDKREWLWATIPALSILFAVGFWLVSQWTMLNEPILVVSDYVSQDAEGAVTEKASVSMAVADALPITLSVAGGEMLVGDNTNYYREEVKDADPAQLRYLYWQGEKAAMTFPSAAPWNLQSIMVRGHNPPPVKVDGTCWFEEDGLHVRLVNEGEYALAAGQIITPYGYCSTKELLPGQSADYFLKNAEEPAKGKQPVANGSGNYPIYDGVLFSAIQQSNMDVYSIFSAIVYPEMWTDSQESVYMTQADYEERALLNSLYDQAYGKWDVYRNGYTYHYLSFDDSLCNMEFAMNGETVKRTAQLSTVDITLKYEPMSPNGFMKYGHGSIPVYTAERDDDGNLARDVQIREAYRYFRLSDKPIFCFMLPKEAAKAEISKMNITSQAIYQASDCEFAVYNQKTKKWDKMDALKDMAEQIDLSVHLSPEGEIFVQCSPGSTAGTYSEISSPSMNLEGRIR